MEYTEQKVLDTLKSERGLWGERAYTFISNTLASLPEETRSQYPEDDYQAFDMAYDVMKHRYNDAFENVGEKIVSKEEALAVVAIDEFLFGAEAEKFISCLVDSIPAATRGQYPIDTYSAFVTIRVAMKNISKKMEESMCIDF